MKAIFNGQIIAQSDQTILIEGNHYFPPESIHMEFLEQSETQTLCHWKGTASYHNVVVDGLRNPDSAWYYSQPKDAAEKLKNYIAFWRGIEVVE